jgi:hemerythrin superfamily protein
MADDKSKRGSPDNKRLNKSEPYEMAYARSKRAGSASKTASKSKRSSESGGAASKARGNGGATRRAGAAAKRASKSAAPAMKRANAAPRKQPGEALARATPKPPKEEKTAENTAPRTMKEADAVDLLVDDHLRVSALFKQYEKLAKKEAPGDQRQSLAQAICAMLKAHTTIEEEIFYPAARAAGVDQDLLDEADVEHASAKDLISQIEAARADDDHYDAKVKVLGEYITHHVVEEHTEMFPKCRRAGMDLVVLRDELESREMALLPDAGVSANDASAAPGPATGILAKINQTLFTRA